MSDNSAEGIQNDQIKTESVEKKEKKTVIPQGIGAAGKVWRKKHEQKFSLFATNGALQIKTSWQEKEERRKRLQRTKELEKSITERRIEEKRQRRQQIEERRARREQNEIKSMKVQTIRDTNKLKKMSKKQLKQIKKTRVDKNGNVEYVSAYAKILSLISCRRKLIHVADPQEQRQEVLIKRVTNSIDRLSQELADLVVQMDGVLQYQSNMEYLANIWKGCEERMRANTRI
ncbi:hypothetical protein JH06_1016 [Blastocystis sp. subtype 4]|uniref:hypothetical protein n=1 Tax=Blastocystis sp. subtype 4 TaxID=944170 RepID=UPI0007120922|nr:hypothetical protein JH06_1016 [Blastocystis sp. subtype 4]KNB46161.1 hypothetical protein JH06_1016 [Blastocystis sp. subtype 4]|eukprot:XP_014529588.1 hypothetical protein JH06_1016 [Blastocystis sp. subtype 4]